MRDTQAATSAPITAGDWIGLVRGDGIVAVGDSTSTAPRSALLDQLVDAARELVTVITGDGADAGARPPRSRGGSPSTAPDVQVEVHRGGQPLYPYLFGVE